MKWEPKSQHRSKAAAKREALWLEKAGYETKVEQIAYLRPRLQVFARPLEPQQPH